MHGVISYRLPAMGSNYAASLIKTLKTGAFILAQNASNFTQL